MNLLELVLKQMRQRALSTWLTLLSVLLGVGLAVAIMIIRRQGAAIFGQTDYGYDVLIGAKGSPLQLVLNTVYHLDKSPGNIPYTLYDQLTHDRKYLGDVHTAVPFVVGDSYQNRPIVGTLPTLFDTPLTRVRDAVNGERDLAATIRTTIQENQPLSSDVDFSTQQEALRDELAGALPMVAAYVPSTAATIQKGLDEIDAATKLGEALPTNGTTVPTDNGVIKALQVAADTLQPAQQALADEMGIDSSLNLRTVGPLPYRPNKLLQLDQGRAFCEDKFQAVLGSDVTHLTNPPLKIGDTFQATHGFPAKGQIPDIHPSVWKVVGILQQTHTAADRVVYIPMLTFYTIAEHGAGLVAQQALRTGGDPNAAIKQMEQLEQKKKAASSGELMQDVNAKPQAPAAEDDDSVKHYTVDSGGRIHLDASLPKTVWGLSGIMVHSRSPALVMSLMYDINNGEEAAAVNPASTMRDFFAIFLQPSTIVLQVIVALTTVVAGVGILVSIYNSVSARLREIAILRALGATRVRILTLICVEAGLIGLIGGLLGLLTGHLLGLFGSIALERMIGEGFDWVATDYWEWLYLLAVVVLAILAGLVPALKAYRTPVATNLTAA